MRSVQPGAYCRSILCVYFVSGSYRKQYRAFWAADAWPDPDANTPTIVQTRVIPVRQKSVPAGRVAVTAAMPHYYKPVPAAQTGRRTAPAACASVMRTEGCSCRRRSVRDSLQAHIQHRNIVDNNRPHPNPRIRICPGALRIGWAGFVFPKYALLQSALMLPSVVLFVYAHRVVCKVKAPMKQQPNCTPCNANLRGFRVAGLLHAGRAPVLQRGRRPQ